MHPEHASNAIKASITLHNFVMSNPHSKRLVQNNQTIKK